MLDTLGGRTSSRALLNTDIAVSTLSSANLQLYVKQQVYIMPVLQSPHLTVSDEINEPVLLFAYNWKLQQSFLQRNYLYLNMQAIRGSQRYLCYTFVIHRLVRLTDLEICYILIFKGKIGDPDKSRRDGIVQTSHLSSYHKDERLTYSNLYYSLQDVDLVMVYDTNHIKTQTE